ncbi:hypothetical protein [Hymenobacter sp.]|uniref:hypothetical protein n=1 Tax=Hymenobacter sp. TaxID=1898978 RepID=UPI00286D6271|nr:hypothetical protein [Hymenobacter sp.]
MEITPNPTVSNLIAFGKILPGLLIILLLALINVHEWYVVGIVANPKDITQYPFGSEGPVAGVAHYQSAELYARYCLISSLFTIPALIGFAFAVYRRTATATVAAYGILVLTIVGFWITG